MLSHSHGEIIPMTGVVFVLMFGVFFYVSRRKMNSIEERLNSMLSVVENANNEIFVFDLESSEILFSNTGLRENLGYSGEEIQKMQPHEFFKGINEYDFQARMESVSEGVQQQWRMLKKDDSDYCVIVNFQKTIFRGRQAVFAVAQNISEQISEIEHHQQVLANRLLEQHALNNILAIPNSTQTPLKDKLTLAIREILQVPWMALMKKGGVFLTEGEELQLVVSENLGATIEGLCEKVQKGHCLCGRAFESGKAVHASCVDERHETTFEGISPHGHYNIPILEDGKVLGVMVFYLPDGHPRSLNEIKFLESCAEIISRVIITHRSEADLVAAREKDAVNALIVTYNHEINNPLAIAKGSVMLMKRRPEETKHLEKLERSLDRIEEIVKTVTSISAQNKVYYEHYAGKTKMMNLSQRKKKA